MHPGLRPDLTILLDAPVAIGMSRAGRRSSPDRIEVERSDFFGRVRDCYLELAAAEPDRFRIIDASASIELVSGNVNAAINQLLDENVT